MSQSQKTFLVVGLVLITWSLCLFPFHRVTSKEAIDNPHHAPYYIGLQSILANYALLSTDTANIRFIKNRLYQFERDSKKLSRRHAEIVAPYSRRYFTVLNDFGAKTINDIANNDFILEIANSTSDTIDSFYLDAKLFHLNPLYSWDAGHSKRILQYNLGGIYANIPNRYMRILGAYLADAQLGVYSGFFVNNQTTTLETQFMTGMPMLTALYVMPKYDYGATGTLSTMVPWGYFGAHSLTDPVIRKMLDISGIDIFGVSTLQMLSRNIRIIPNAVPFKPEVRPFFNTDYIPYQNLGSYGIAYLANHIKLEDPSHIKLYEAAIKDYFSRPIDHDPQKFIETINVLYSKLLALKKKHDIILETKSSTIHQNSNSDIAPGIATISGIVGERVLLHTNCRRDECALVLNMADTPGWHAFVNGDARDISRANFAFMEVNVPEGDSTVWFIYSPLSSTVSYFISIITLLSLLIICQKKRDDVKGDI